ncbi:MAG: hypothetical protein IPL61_22985 [Myxococcales bacterium]|nr:hypothetical protein [Myxococcales bacterium]
MTVERAGGPVDDGERYAYGADRLRVRKVATRLVVGGTDPVIETREVLYLDGGQERVRVRRGATIVLERWTTHVADGERRSRSSTGTSWTRSRRRWTPSAPPACATT